MAFASKRQKLNQRAQKPYVFFSKENFHYRTNPKAHSVMLSLSLGKKLPTFHWLWNITVHSFLSFSSSVPCLRRDMSCYLPFSARFPAVNATSRHEIPTSVPSSTINELPRRHKLHRSWDSCRSDHRRELSLPSQDPTILARFLLPS